MNCLAYFLSSFPASSPYSCFHFQSSVTWHVAGQLQRLQFQICTVLSWVRARAPLEQCRSHTPHLCSNFFGEKQNLNLQKLPSSSLFPLTSVIGKYSPKPHSQSQLQVWTVSTESTVWKESDWSSSLQLRRSSSTRPAYHLPPECIM